MEKRKNGPNRNGIKWNYEPNENFSTDDQIEICINEKWTNQNLTQTEKLNQKDQTAFEPNEKFFGQNGPKWKLGEMKFIKIFKKKPANAKVTKSLFFNFSLKSSTRSINCSTVALENRHCSGLISDWENPARI